MGLCNLLKVKVEGILHIDVVVQLQSDGEITVVVHRLPLEIELQEGVRLLVVLDLKSLRELVKLRVRALQRLVAEHAHQTVLELCAGPVHHIHRIIVREAHRKISLGHDRAERLVADGARGQKENVNAKRVLQNV